MSTHFSSIAILSTDYLVFITYSSDKIEKLDYILEKINYKLNKKNMKLWQPGKQLQESKYVIKDILRSRNFDVTYSGKNQLSDKLVTIQTLNPSVEIEPDFVKHQERFVREASCLANCSDRHLLTVEDLYQEGEFWCMVTEYIAGKNLQQHIEDEGVLSPEEAFDYIQQTGEALNCVHQQGLLHRDVKPDNIMLHQDTAVLIDFALAQEFAKDRTVPHTNGKINYFAAPEQYEKHGKQGVYTDLYALAATLYYLLTSKLPFDAGQRKYGKVDLIPPKQHNPDLSDRVNEAILQGMALKPQDRPSSVQEWLKSIEKSKVIYSASPSMPVFEFDAVTVNASGEEVKREKGKAQYFSEQLQKSIILLGKVITLEMMAIPGGEFMMGCRQQEGDESPKTSTQSKNLTLLHEQISCHSSTMESDRLFTQNQSQTQIQSILF